MTPSPNPPKNTPKKPAKKEEKKSLKAMLPWVFVAIGVIGIIWMIAASPREKQLRCSSHGSTSLTGFGSCTEE